MPFTMRLIALVCSALAGLQAAAAQGEKRVALVIGNAAYRAVAELPNPKKDAGDVAAALRAAGFAEVVERYDLGVREMQQALSAFEDKATGADWAVVYYAGHGIEVDGRNYLVPVDAELKRATDVEDETLPLDRVLARVAAARKLQLVVLDACRFNPFRQRMAGMGTRAVGERGLGRIEPAQPNVIVAYAARDGQVALDGKAGDNSPYAGALVKHLGEPGLELQRLFRKVREDVMADTGGQQRPYEYGSLIGPDLFFRPGAAASAKLPEAPPPVSAPPHPSAAALEWGRVDKTSIAELETFERRHPSSPEAEYARARLKALGKVAVATPAPSNLQPKVALTPNPSLPPFTPFHTRPISMVVPFAPGGTTDITARLIIEHMARTLGQPVLVSNKVGASGAIGAADVARGPSDGHTMLIHTDAIATAPAQGNAAAFAPVGLVHLTPMVLVSKTSGAPSNLKELVQAMRAKGAGMTIASSGVGTDSHVCAEYLKQTAGADFVHVAYRGASAALADVASGMIDVMCVEPAAAAAALNGGSARAHAVLGRARIASVPNVPTSAEAGMPELQFASYAGLYVRKGTPSAAVAALNAALQRALADSALAARLTQMGVAPAALDMRSPEAHASYLAADTGRRVQLLRAAGVGR